MENPAWGQLPKSQIDPEKIEEAIARMIKAHNDDPAAHTEAGQSLYNHKVAEVIQHAVASIVADKIKNGEIGEAKLKGSLLGEKDVAYTRFETFDGWTEYGYGEHGYWCSFAGGSIWVDESDEQSFELLEALSADWNKGLNLAKNPYFDTEVYIKDYTDITSYIVAGYLQSTEGACFGFKFDKGVSYAVHQKNNIEEKTDITSHINLDQFNNLKAFYYSGNKIEFYVNDVLVATHTTNLPTIIPASGRDRYFTISLKNYYNEEYELYMWKNLIFKYLKVVTDK